METKIWATILILIGFIQVVGGSQIEYADVIISAIMTLTVIAILELRRNHDENCSGNIDQENSGH
jgi:hypothetical protein